MLIIERHADESFTVRTPAGDVTVMVTKIAGGQVYLGITAPKEWAIARDDIRNPSK